MNVSINGYIDLNNPPFRLINAIGLGELNVNAIIRPSYGGVNYYTESYKPEPREVVLYVEAENFNDVDIRTLEMHLTQPNAVLIIAAQFGTYRAKILEASLRSDYDKAASVGGVLKLEIKLKINPYFWTDGDGLNIQVLNSLTPEITQIGEAYGVLPYYPSLLYEWFDTADAASLCWGILKFGETPINYGYIDGNNPGGSIPAATKTNAGNYSLYTLTADWPWDDFVDDEPADPYWHFDADYWQLEGARPRVLKLFGFVNFINWDNSNYADEIEIDIGDGKIKRRLKRGVHYYWDAAGQAVNPFYKAYVFYLGAIDESLKRAPLKVSLVDYTGSPEIEWGSVYAFKMGCCFNFQAANWYVQPGQVRFLAGGGIKANYTGWMSLGCYVDEIVHKYRYAWYRFAMPTGFANGERSLKIVERVQGFLANV